MTACIYHLPVLNLSTVFRRPALNWTLISAIPCGKDTGCDVVLEKLLVHYVDNSRDNCFDVLLSRYQSLDVIYNMAVLEWTSRHC